MGNSYKRAALIILVILLFLIVSILPGTLLARDPISGFYDPDVEAVVGGEPGEDPHLKVSPVIPVKECEPFGATGNAGAGDIASVYTGSWEGESGLGSRVNRVWRLVLQMWFWTLQR